MTSGKIRICHIITGLGSGGAEAMLMKLVSSLDPELFENIVVSLIDRGKYGDLLEQQGIPVFTLDLKNRQRLLSAPFVLRRILNDFKPDIIQGWMAHGNLAALFSRLPLVADADIIWNIRQSLNNFAHIPRATRWAIEMNARLSRIPHSIIYNSHVGAAEHEAIGYAKDKSTIIPNGFDTDLFKPCPETHASFRRKHGLSNNALLIGLVGRWDPLKDHPNFVYMSRALAARDSNIHFVLAGQNMGPSNAALTTLIQQHGVADRTHLLGEVTNSADVMAALDIFVLCSLAEGFPNVVGEAMACGVPCVVTDVGECRTIIGDSGNVIPSGDPSALIAAVKSLLDKGPDARAHLGSLARNRILENYSLGSIVTQYEALYAATYRGRTRGSL